MKSTSTLLLCLSFLSLIAQIPEPITLSYESNKSALTTEHRLILDSVINRSISVDSSQYKIRVEAHTDSDGDDDFNQRLAQNRGSHVFNYLNDSKIAQKDVSLLVSGESKPIVSNKSEEGKKLNRRVSISFHPKPMVVKLQSIEKLYAKTKVDQQEFTILNHKDTTIRCLNGSLVYIPAYSFSTRGRLYKGRKLTLQISEFLDKSSAILGDITTTSDDNILESAGMIHIQAKAGIAPLKLIKGKSLKIMIPKKSEQTAGNMQVFTGDRSAHNRLVNWTINNNSVLSSLDCAAILYCSEFRCGTDRQTPCPFFFCKVNRFMSRLFSKPDTMTNSEFKISYSDTCTRLVELFKKYGVDNRDDLIDAVNKPLYEKYGVNNINDLQDAIEVEKINQIETNYSNHSVAFEDLQYYIFNTPSLDWINIDDFLDMGNLNLITMTVPLKPQVNTDVKLVFKNRQTILPPDETKKEFYFKNIPQGEEVWIVALKYDHGKPLLAMQETTISQNAPVLEFKELSLEELKKELKKLDF